MWGGRRVSACTAEEEPAQGADQQHERRARGERHGAPAAATGWGQRGRWRRHRPATRRAGRVGGRVDAGRRPGSSGGRRGSALGKGASGRGGARGLARCRDHGRRGERRGAVAAAREQPGGLAGQRGRTQRDGVLGVGVDDGGPAEGVGDHAADQRDPGGAADEQDRGELFGGDVGRAQGAGERADGGLDLGADEVLEVGAGDSDVEVAVG